MMRATSALNGMSFTEPFAAPPVEKRTSRRIDHAPCTCSVLSCHLDNYGYGPDKERRQKAGRLDLQHWTHSAARQQGPVAAPRMDRAALDRLRERASGKSTGRHATAHAACAWRRVQVHCRSLARWTVTQTNSACPAVLDTRAEPIFPRRVIAICPARSYRPLSTP